jgi:hypothetical protein
LAFRLVSKERVTKTLHLSNDVPNLGREWRGYLLVYRFCDRSCFAFVYFDHLWTKWTYSSLQIVIILEMLLPLSFNSFSIVLDWRSTLFRSNSTFFWVFFIVIILKYYKFYYCTEMASTKTLIDNK